MVAARNNRRTVSPVFLAGAASVAIVLGVSVLRIVSAEEPSSSQPQVLHTEVKTTTATEPETNAQTEPSSSTEPPSSDDTSSTSRQNAASVSKGSVTVNGQTYTLPGDGELHKTTSDASGQTSIDISVQSSGSGQNYSSSSSNVQMNTSSFNMTQSNGSTSP